MHRTTIDAWGSVRLGDDALRLGFRPGVTIEVIATRAGSLILVPAAPVPVEADCLALPAGSVLALGPRGRQG